ncbi:hypothetical protein BX600DRAFT_296651 [Xylariales sp. PMI_506]|nr:hypothetical protein BX600DRAFT_296651 [Xylariales sp. PMI_506]
MWCQLGPLARSHRGSMPLPVAHSSRRGPGSTAGTQVYRVLVTQPLIWCPDRFLLPLPCPCCHSRKVGCGYPLVPRPNCSPPPSHVRTSQRWRWRSRGGGSVRMDAASHYLTPSTWDLDAIGFRVGPRSHLPGIKPEDLPPPNLQWRILSITTEFRQFILSFLLYTLFGDSLLDHSILESYYRPQHSLWEFSS